VFNFFRRRRSKDDLKQRLKLVLSYDRARLSPGKMEQLKRELLGVVEKYFPADGDDLDVRFEQHGDRMVLIADLPRPAQR
jgi:cell division topological specificity factor